jgi:transposase-like protein
MICLLCGGAIHQITDFTNGPKILGYKCKSFGEEWLIKDNKTFESWAFQHIRLLEEKLELLLKKLGV